LTNISHTVSLLIPVIAYNIRTPEAWSSAKHFWMASVDSAVLEVERWPFHPSSHNDFRPSLNLLRHSNTDVIDKYSSPYTFSTFQTFQQLFSLILHKTKSLLFVPFLNLWHDEKTNFTRMTVILICINRTSWNFHIV
jgi:hypothetical protein